jgi:hypothetical protein
MKNTHGTGWNKVVAAANTKGLDLSDPRQFAKAKELTLPVFKRPLTSNPFIAALAAMKTANA